MINPISIKIVIISHNVSSRTVKAVKIFFSKVLEVEIDNVPEPIVCYTTISILPESIKNVFLDKKVISSLKVNRMVEKIFRIGKILKLKCDSRHSIV